MPKVSEIKFEIKGIPYKVNVNCTSGGLFNVNIPTEVAEALRINEKLTSETLSDIEKQFHEKLSQYKNSETKEELFILISYQSTGKYSYKKDGSTLFGPSDKKYNINISFAEISNAVGFDFTVGIKQTIDGKEKWFNAKLGKDFSWIQEKQYSHPDIYHKDSEIYHSKLQRYKIIPFNDQALNTLKDAQEKLRILSEMLFNFITQDEEKILLTLVSGKLLN